MSFIEPQNNGAVGTKCQNETVVWDPSKLFYEADRV